MTGILIGLAFTASLVMIFGLHLLQVCTQHNYYEVKTEYFVSSILIIISIGLWIVFSSLV